MCVALQSVGNGDGRKTEAGEWLWRGLKAGAAGRPQKQAKHGEFRLLARGKRLFLEALTSIFQNQADRFHSSSDQISL